jgi:hypothetical protein
MRAEGILWLPSDGVKGALRPDAATAGAWYFPRDGFSINGWERSQGRALAALVRREINDASGAL